MVVITIIQGGSRYGWLPSFRAVVGCWDSQWGHGTAIVIRWWSLSLPACSEVVCHWGCLQLVAVVVAVSRGDDDGCWWSWLLLSFWMVVVVAIIHGSDAQWSSDGGSSHWEGTLTYKACVIISARWASERLPNLTYLLTRWPIGSLNFDWHE